MDLRQMEYVVTLAEERQFTRAALLCGVSQSGLSAAIRSLEEELGTVLFDRTTRSVDLTAAGRALLRHARILLAEAAAARDAVVRSPSDIAGPLRIGSEQCLGIVDPANVLDHVHRLAPTAELTFVQAGSHDLVAQVRAGELDIGLVATDEHLGPLHRLELGRQRLVLLVPPHSTLRDTREPTWNDLQDRDFVDFHPAWGIRSRVDAAFAEHRISRRVRCTVNDVHTLLDLVQRGLGMAIVPSHVSAKPQASGLVTLPMPPDAPAWIVSAVTANPPGPAAAVLTSLLGAEEMEAAHR